MFKDPSNFIHGTYSTWVLSGSVPPCSLFHYQCSGYFPKLPISCTNIPWLGLEGFKPALHPCLLTLTFVQTAPPGKHFPLNSCPAACEHAGGTNRREIRIPDSKFPISLMLEVGHLEKESLALSWSSSWNGAAEGGGRPWPGDVCVCVREILVSLGQCLMTALLSQPLFIFTLNSLRLSLKWAKTQP